jgi:hypothetical protein
MATLYKEVPHIVFESWHDQQFLEPIVSKADRKVLRELGQRLAEMADHPLNARRKELWKRMNDLRDGKPMVWVNEVCWNEMEVADELALRTKSPFCQRIEAQMRQTIYQWEHMQGDMVVDPVIAAPLVVENSGLGLSFQEDILATDEENEIVSHRFHIQVRGEEDIEKIKEPAVTYREELTQKGYEAYRAIFDGILTVEKRGIQGFWFAPWDDIVRLTGVQEAIMDLILRPSYIHALVKRIVDAYLGALDQFERLNLLASNNNNSRIGSGAYGYTTALPPGGPGSGRSRAADIWGAATAQIFSTVSPEMHEEFALAYERRWLERFGLSYYGCCEPLDKKIGVLRSIPNLRKISMSPWIDKEKAAEAISSDYVFSFKPSPAVLAKERWNPEEARQELVTMLEIARRYRCRVEIIMKDISTVHFEPQRLWEWARISFAVPPRSPA